MRPLLLIMSLTLSACSGDDGSTEPHDEAPAPEAPAELAFTWSRSSLEPLATTAMAPRPIHLLIPDGDPPAGGFPFLVVTDGDAAFTETFGVHTAIIPLVNRGAIPPCVVIAVPAVDRTAELTPSLTSRRTLRRGSRTRNPRSGVEAFADYVVNVVLLAVAERVPLADHGAIFGYSYGGLAALHFALRYPDRFPRVIAMSPSLWFAQRAALFAVDRAPALPQRVWLDVGTREGDPNEDFPYMVADARQLRQDLLRREVSVDYEVVGRSHGSGEAAARMSEALRYALSDGDCAITELSVHAFRQESRVGHLVPTTVLGRCADGAPRTLSPRDVRFEVQGGRVSADGHLRASRVGIVHVRALAQGLQGTDSIRFRR